MVFVDFVVYVLVLDLMWPWTTPVSAHYFFSGTISFEPVLAHSLEHNKSILDPAANTSHILVSVCVNYLKGLLRL